MSRISEQVTSISQRLPAAVDADGDKRKANTEMSFSIEDMLYKNEDRSKSTRFFVDCLRCNTFPSKRVNKIEASFGCTASPNRRPPFAPRSMDLHSHIRHILVIFQSPICCVALVLCRYMSIREALSSSDNNEIPLNTWISVRSSRRTFGDAQAVGGALQGAISVRSSCAEHTHLVSSGW